MIRQKGDNNLKIAIIQVCDMAGLRIGCKSNYPPALWFSGNRHPLGSNRF